MAPSKQILSLSARDKNLRVAERSPLGGLTLRGGLACKGQMPNAFRSRRKVKLKNKATANTRITKRSQISLDNQAHSFFVRLHNARDISPKDEI
jgi:hypothetical protein